MKRLLVAFSLSLSLFLVAAVVCAQDSPRAGEEQFNGKYMGFNYPKGWTLFSGDEALEYIEPGADGEPEGTEMVLLIKGDYTIESLKKANEDDLMGGGFLMVGAQPDPFAGMEENQETPWYEMMFGNLENQQGVEVLVKETVSVSQAPGFHVRAIMPVEPSGASPEMDTTIYAVRSGEHLIVISAFGSTEQEEPPYLTAVNRIIDSFTIK